LNYASESAKGVVDFVGRGEDLGNVRIQDHRKTVLPIASGILIGFGVAEIVLREDLVGIDQ
jgi:hypothetical protein